MYSTDKYRTFKRRANSFEELARARKIHDQGNLSLWEANRRCQQLNAARSPKQIVSGIKFEFEKE